jgi:hypothetical protein
VATYGNNYDHLMADFDLRPLQIRKHLVETHHVTPHIPRKRYEREVWHGQHEMAHSDEKERYDGYLGAR